MVDEEVGDVGEVVEQLGLKQHDRGSNKGIIGEMDCGGVFRHGEDNRCRF